jgi:hypothetical protein
MAWPKQIKQTSLISEIGQVIGVALRYAEWIEPRWTKTSNIWYSFNSMLIRKFLKPTCMKGQIGGAQASGSAAAFLFLFLPMMGYTRGRDKQTAFRLRQSIIHIKFIPTKMHLMFASWNLVKPHHLNYFCPSDFKSMAIEGEPSQQPRSCKNIVPIGSLRSARPSMQSLTNPTLVIFSREIHFLDSSSSPLSHISNATSQLKKLIIL